MPLRKPPYISLKSPLILFQPNLFPIRDFTPLQSISLINHHETMPRVPNRYPRRSAKADSSRLSLTSACKAKKLTIHLRQTTNNTSGQKCNPDKAQNDKKSEYL